MSHFRTLWVMYRSKCPLAVLADYVEEYLEREQLWSFSRRIEERQWYWNQVAQSSWRDYINFPSEKGRDRYDRATRHDARLGRLWLDLMALEQVLDQREVSHV